MPKKSMKILFKAAVFVIIISAAFYLALLARENGVVKELIREYGYYGIFAVAVVSGFNFAVPVPAVAFLPLFLEAGLNFWLAIILIALGTTFADAFAYLVGRLGRQVVELHSKSKLISGLEKAQERHWWLPITVLFLFASFVPFPNEILVAPLGFLNYRFTRIWPVVLAGNFIFNLIYSAGAITLFEVI